LPVSVVLFFGRFGLSVPYRQPLVTIVGKWVPHESSWLRFRITDLLYRPIPCPRVRDPSPELVNEYHELYMKETRRIFNKFRNVMGWKNKILKFNWSLVSS
jgi:hypothetical protein